MKRITLLIIILLTTGANIFAESIDSLKLQLLSATTDSARAVLNTKLAVSNYSLANNNVGYNKWVYQVNSINYTMQALHLYSKLSDTTGLISSYSHLSKTYRSQAKYAQAKWFILQANTLSRKKNIIPSIVSTLVDLATIKMDVNDYKLAKRDLNEAYRWLSANRDSALYVSLKTAYLRLSSKIKVPDNENILLKGAEKPVLATVKQPVSKKTVKKKQVVASVVNAPKKVFPVVDKQTYASEVTISL